MKVLYVFLLLIVCTLVISGCRVETVGDPNRPIKIEAHITIDIRQVKDTVSSIEDMVSGKQPVKAAPDKNSKSLLAEYAYAQDEVQSAIESRKARYQAIKDHKRQGLIGENNKGYLTAFSEDSAVKNLVEQENRDRLIIYKSIVEQKGYPKDAISQIEEVSAQEQRDRAETGEKIQQPSGEWTVK